jgi:hypothetical protein
MAIQQNQKTKDKHEEQKHNHAAPTINTNNKVVGKVVNHIQMNFLKTTVSFEKYKTILKTFFEK